MQGERGGALFVAALSLYPMTTTTAFGARLAELAARSAATEAAAYVRLAELRRAGAKLANAMAAAADAMDAVDAALEAADA